MLRLGYKASAEQFGPVELLDFAVHAEQCGFDSVVVSDHFQPWRHTGGHAPFSFTWLGAVGARTERVMLGTSVVSAIAADELTATANTLQSRTFRSFEIYLVVTGLYLALSLAFRGAFAVIYRVLVAPVPEVARRAER